LFRTVLQNIGKGDVHRPMCTYMQMNIYANVHLFYKFHKCMAKLYDRHKMNCKTTVITEECF